MRGGSTKNICNISLELAVGNLEKDPIAMSDELCSTIQGLDDGSFKNRPTQRKNALCHKLDEVATLIDYASSAGDPGVGNLYYIEAITKLSNDIGAKMDAQFGGHPNNDWITDRDTQTEVHPLVHELIEVLQGKLS
jgi:hypothetical protein